MLISIPDAATRLNVSRLFIHRRIKDGTIKAIKVGRQYVIDESDLPKQLTAREPGRKPKEQTK